MANEFTVAAKSEDCKRAANWQTLNKEFQSFLGDFHPPTTHRTTPVNQEYKAEFLTFGQLRFFGGFLRNYQILRLWWLESGHKTGQTSILVC